MKKRTIKVTREQLREAYPDAYEYLDSDSDVKPYDGTTDISVTGKLSDEEDGMPVTTDDIANMVTNQNSPYGYRPSGYARPYISEDDNNGDGVDDFYNHSELDTISNGDKNDDITRVPESVIRKIDILIEAMSPLNGKQKAMLLNKLVENIDMTQVPSQWRKELALKITSGKNGAQQIN